MVRSTTPLVLAAGLVVVAAAPLRADGPALKLEAGYASLSNAKDSFQAVFDSSSGVTYGGELAYGFGRHVYVSLEGRLLRMKDGQRVFVESPGKPVFKLGHPVNVRIVPVFATVGYRFRAGFIAPYVGLGVGLASYREEDSLKGVGGQILDTTRTSETKASARVVAGVEIGGGSLRLGLEAAYASTPNAIGIAGVSKVYNEKDIGGFSVVGKIILTRSR